MPGPPARHAGAISAGVERRRRQHREATWSPPAAGVAIRTEGLAQLQLSAGLFEPADAPVPSALHVAIQRDDTIWLPAVPQPFSWTLRLSVTGDARVHVCSME